MFPTKVCLPFRGSGPLSDTWCLGPRKSTTNYKPFVGFWQPRKAGLNKHTGKSYIHKIHKITSLEMTQSKYVQLVTDCYMFL